MMMGTHDDDRRCVTSNNGGGPFQYEDHAAFRHLEEDEVNGMSGANMV